MVGIFREQIDNKLGGWEDCNVDKTISTLVLRCEWWLTSGGNELEGLLSSVCVGSQATNMLTVTVQFIVMYS